MAPGPLRLKGEGSLNLTIESAESNNATEPTVIARTESAGDIRRSCSPIPFWGGQFLRGRLFTFPLETKTCTWYVS